MRQECRQKPRTPWHGESYLHLDISLQAHSPMWVEPPVQDRHEVRPEELVGKEIPTWKSTSPYFATLRKALWWFQNTYSQHNLSNNITVSFTLISDIFIYYYKWFDSDKTLVRLCLKEILHLKRTAKIAWLKNSWKWQYFLFLWAHDMPFDLILRT